MSVGMVKCSLSNGIFNFEDAVNRSIKTLENQHKDIIDIKFCISEQSYNAMIIYK